MSEYTMCAYCHSVNGGHTLACQAIHMDGQKPAQIPVPEDSPWLARRRAEKRSTAADQAPTEGW